MDNALNISPQRSKLQDLINGWPIIQFIGAGLIGLVATWTTLQLSQQSQAAKLSSAESRLERLEKDAVPRELFDERTNKIIAEQERQYSLLIKILEDKGK